MKKNLSRVSTLLALGLLASCTQKKLSQAQQTQNKDVVATATASTAAAPSTPAPREITYLRMERTPCFGRCPNYALEIRSDGMVRYYGYMFTQYSGIYEIGIGERQAAELLKEFASYRPDTCAEVYELPIADLPGLNYTFHYSDSEEKSISNAHFGPEFLKDFSRKLDQTLMVDDSWRVIADTATR
jgi:hypothetical protein